MTLRILNDDPRCKRPNDCQISSIQAAKLCITCRARSPSRGPWRCPAGLEQMFDDLRRKFGMKEARRLVEDHAARKR